MGVGKILSLLSGALLALALAGCAGGKASREPVFWPPDPNPPRVQFLKGVSGSKDVTSNSSVKLLSLNNEEDEGPKVIAKPYGVAFSKGKFYVVDTIQNNIAIFDLVKETFEILPNKGRGKLKKPINLSIASNGNLFVADSFRKEILEYDEMGNFVKAYGKDLDMKPVDVAVDDSKIYALDITHSEIKVIDRATGEPAGSLGKLAEGQQDGLSLPTNLTMDKDGFLYVTNSGTGKVIKLDRDGHIVHSFGRLGDSFGEFGRPRGITVDDKGRILVADASHQNVQIFNETGRILMFFGDPGYVYESLNLPAGVTTITSNLDYFQKFAAPGFVLEEVIVVTNQFGPTKVSFYGLGQMKDFKGYENIKPAEKGKGGAAEQKK